MTCFYFYIFDEDFGPCFLKICSYFPYPAKLWCNGHEWAKQQARRNGIAFTALENGFAACSDPGGIQALADQLGPDHIHSLFERWVRQLPARPAQ